MAYAWTKDTGGTLSTNLVAYYALEDTSDSKGTRTLTNTGSVTFTAGKHNNDANFGNPNTTKYLVRDADNYGIQGGVISISAWVYLEDESARYEQGAVVIECNDATARVVYGIVYRPGDNKFYFERVRTGVVENSVSSAASVDTWYHVVLTYDGTDVEGFVNGSSIGTIGSTGNAGNDEGRNSNFRIGVTNNDVNNLWQGIIGEVGIWSKELSATEISDLYNSGAGSFYEEGSPSSSSTFIPRVMFY